MRSRIPGFSHQAFGDPAATGNFSYANLGQVPNVLVPLQSSGSEQAIIEAAGDQRAVSQTVFDQLRIPGKRGEQPFGSVAVNFLQILQVLVSGLV
ncbi:hypothetical protein D3C72_2253180 [compost metagenome]